MPPSVRTLAITAFVLCASASMVSLWMADHWITAWLLGAASIGVVSWSWDDKPPTPPDQPKQ